MKYIRKRYRPDTADTHLAVSAAVFSICGLLLSVFYIWYCFAESYRINAVNNLMKKIIEANFSVEYTKMGLTSFLEHKGGNKKPPLKILHGEW